MGRPKTVHDYWLHWCDRHWLLAVSPIYIWSENSSTKSEASFVLTAQTKNNGKGLELTTFNSSSVFIIRHLGKECAEISYFDIDLKNNTMVL